MVDYTHKKSIRKITDEQFSEGTTIDGSRIDSALEDVRERAETMHKGDISTRFTQHQYVFGYQPCGFPASGYTGDGADGAIVNWPYFLNSVYTTTGTPPSAAPKTVSRYFTRFPWMVVKNDQFTTIDPQPGAGVLLRDFVGAYPDHADKKYDPKNYHNKFQHKGFDLSGSEHLVTRGMKNDSAWFNNDSAGGVTSIRWWREGRYNVDTSSGASGSNISGHVVPKTDHQMAWTQTWYFDKPTIIDDLMVLFRTDAVSNAFNATFKNDTESDSYTGTKHVDQASIQILVDSPLVLPAAANSKQSATVVYARHLIDFDAHLFTRSATVYHATDSYAFASDGSEDMLPSMFDVRGDARDCQLHGAIIRDRQLNIPIPPGSRVSLAVIVPQYFSPSPTTDLTGVAKWPYNGGLAGAKDQYGWSADRVESTFDWSLNGCLTVLEELVG